MKKVIFIMSVVAVILAACEKDNTIPDRFLPIPTGNTNIKFLNMSPGSPQVNFFANGTKITGFTPTATNAVTGMGFAGIYPSAIGYVTLPGGSVKVDAIVPDSSTVLPKTTLVSLTQNFDANKFYTVVLLDTFTQVKTLVVQDDPSVPDETRAYFRIANFVSDGAVKVVVTRTSAGVPFVKTYNNVAPLTVLPYDSLGAGSAEVYKVEYYNVANNVLLGSTTNFAPSQTKKYTFYIRGLMRLVSPNTSRPTPGFYTNF